MTYVGSKPTNVPLTSADIEDGVISAADLGANSVDSSELVDNSVTLAKMAGLARGKIIYGDASGNPAALTVGSNTQVLKSDGTDISWGTDSGGAALTGSTNNQVTTVTGANAITGETNLIYDGTRLGVGAAGASADLANGIHIKTSDSGGGTVNGHADDFLIEHSGSGGMTIYSGTSSEGSIKFGDSGGNDRGIFKYNHSSDSFRLWTNGAEAMVIDSTGAVSKPLQPSFLAVSSSSNFSNVATNASDVTVPFPSEVFDLNGDYNTSTYKFTAPVAGKYQANVNLLIFDVDADATYVRVRFVASNRNVDVDIFEPNWAADRGRHTFKGSVLIDMDAADTLHVTIAQYEGTAQMDSDSTSSHFSAFLAC